MLKTSLNDKEYSYVIKKLKKSLKKSLRKSRKPCKHGMNQYGCCNKKPSVKKTKRCLESSKRRLSPCKYGEDVNGCCNKKPTQKYVKKCRRSRSRSRNVVSDKHIIKKIIRSLRKSIRKSRRKSREHFNGKNSVTKNITNSKNDSANFNIFPEILVGGLAAAGAAAVGAYGVYDAYKYSQNKKNNMPEEKEHKQPVGLSESKSKSVEKTTQEEKAVVEKAKKAVVEKKVAVVKQSKPEEKERFTPDIVIKLIINKISELEQKYGIIIKNPSVLGNIITRTYKKFCASDIRIKLEYLIGKDNHYDVNFLINYLNKLVDEDKYEYVNGNKARIDFPKWIMDPDNIGTQLIYYFPCYEVISSTNMDKTQQKTTDLPINTKIKSNQPNKIKKVVIFTDFDGTITGMPGNDLISSQEYKKLYNVKKKYSDYEGSYMSPELLFTEDTINTYFEEIKKDEKDTKNISEKAKIFLKWAVNPESNVDVVIISRNRIDYIELMLKKNGITDNYTILPIDTNKEITITNYIDINNEFKQQYPSIIILDDTYEDFKLMKNAVDTYNLGNIIKSNIIYAQNKKPKEYPDVWATLQKNIEDDRKNLGHYGGWASGNRYDRPYISKTF